VIVNIKHNNAIMSNIFFYDKKLKIKSKLIKSYSDGPNIVFSTVNYLSKKNKTIFLGTIGLSYDSIYDIISELKLLLENQDNSFIICHNRMEFDKSEIFNIELMDYDEIIKKLTN
jgi:hypothetical protein